MGVSCDEQFAQPTANPFGGAQTTLMHRSNADLRVPDVPDVMVSSAQTIVRFADLERRIAYLEQLADRASPSNAWAEYQCDGCRSPSVSGVRYSCTVCKDVDFCENCVDNARGHEDHMMLRVVYDQQMLGQAPPTNAQRFPAPAAPQYPAPHMATMPIRPPRQMFGTPQ